MHVILKMLCFDKNLCKRHCNNLKFFDIYVNVNVELSSICLYLVVVVEVEVG